MCFDARTLELRYRFGREMFSGPDGVYGMAAVGNELFVVDWDSDAIRVFTLAGAYLRSFGHGDCERPRDLHHFDGRLYLTDGDEDGNNSRIIVLTLEGERLQVWRPDAGREVTELFCIYGRKLLIETRNADGNGDVRLEALQGV